MSLNHFIFYLILFFLFASFGSFFKLSVDRYGTSDSIVFKPSYCFSCKKNLSWWQNIPVISFLIQRGKCFFCNDRLDVNLLYSEVLTAFFSLALIVHSASHGSNLTDLFLMLIFFNVLLWLSMYDFKHRVIPHNITYSTIFLFVIFFVFLKNDYLNPFINIGIAFVFMDMLSIFSAALKKIDFDFNLIVIPLLLWVLISFFLQNYYFLILPILIFYYCIKLNLTLNRYSFISLWGILLLLILFHSYRYIFTTIDFYFFDYLFAGVGVIYFFCEVVFYFLVLFLSDNVLESKDEDAPLKLTIGGGDITVFVLISLFLGYKFAFISLFLSSLLALLFIVFGKFLKYIYKAKSEESQFISFVPYLTLACFIIMMVFL